MTLDLAVRRNKDVILIHTMSIDEDGTTVEVTFQYNKMRGTASGNLIVILLDINGQPLEKQQSCTKQDGLLELSNERVPHSPLPLCKRAYWSWRSFLA